MTSAAIARGRGLEAAPESKAGLSSFWSDCAAGSKAMTKLFESLAASSFDHMSRERGDKNTLSAIAGYAAFVAAHPDMPRSHRERFLRRISRCCEEALERAR